MREQRLRKILPTRDGRAQEAFGVLRQQAAAPA